MDVSKIYLLASSSGRFSSDLFVAGKHILRPPCPACGANLNGWSPPLRFWWDYEFGAPTASRARGNVCFWGHFCLVVTESGRLELDGLPIPFAFQPTELDGGRPLFPSEIYLSHVTIEAPVDADASACKNRICDHCGRFTERREQLTRLRIPRYAIPSFGVFTVTQNGYPSPMFATEEAMAILLTAHLPGLGFYPAGYVTE